MNSTSFTGVFSLIVGAAMFAAVLWVNSYYQRRGRVFADELIRDNPPEYNKRIRANAWGFLVRGFIWGILFSIPPIQAYEYIIAHGLNIWIVISIAMAVSFVVKGILGYLSEMKRLLELN